MRPASPDPFDLARFVEAQDGVWDTALAELRAGAKRSHWMWFVFPQLAGLGSSSTALRFGIRSRAEAEAYLAHPVLGPRLIEGTRAMLAIDRRSALEVLGHPDVLKFHSSMTLFAAVAEAQTEFVRALDKYFGGRLDGATLRLLSR